MGTFFVYLIKSSVCLILFCLLYKTLLSKETFFRFNRLVILFGIAICLLLPLISLSAKKINSFQKPFAELEKQIENINIQRETIIPNQVYRLTKTASAGFFSEISGFLIHFLPAISFIYITGICINFILLTISNYKMFRILNEGKKIRHEKYTIVLVRKNIIPFSFGKCIALSESDYQQNFHEIIAHEKIHLQQKHTPDILFIECIILWFWFNPAVWILKRELRDIHEYEADNGVIQSGVDATKYQLLLIKKAVGANAYALANSISHSKIKKRITMMLKKESSRGSRLKALLFIPLAVASLYAFTRPKIVRTEELFKKTDPVEMKELQTSTFTASIEIKGYASMLSDLNRLYKIMPEKERILHYTTPDVPLIKRMDEHIHSIKNKILEEVYDYITAFSPEVTREDITNSAIIQCDTITEGKYLQCKLMLQVSVVEIAIFTPLINESGFVRKMNLWLAESSEELPITIKLRTLPREKK